MNLKLKTQKFKNITKRDTTLPSNLDNRRTFFQGCQMSMKRPQRVSPSRRIRLGPFSSSFHSMTSSLNPWKAVDLKMVFGCVVSKKQLIWRCFWVRDWWGTSIRVVTDERGAEEIWGLGISIWVIWGFAWVRDRHVSGTWLLRARITNSSKSGYCRHYFIIDYQCRLPHQ